jgi:hypothetical protein
MQSLVTSARGPGLIHHIARTAGFNGASAVAVGLGGVVIAIRVSTWRPSIPDSVLDDILAAK